MSFTIGSLFDGSGGFPLAASMCGGTPIWAAEVEPYPIAVTTSRFPNMKHLGSVTDVKGSEVEPVDVLCFGAPCQDLSVAGLRKGIRHDSLGDGETTRSGLFMEAVRIIKEMREATNGVYPRFAIYENVPGAFSSSKGQDFRIVLEELIKVVEPTAVMPEVPKNGWPYADSYCGDGWSLAYRVLDAQFWGVPQRRRRIYLVADFRGECAGKVSFEREGLRGYFKTGRTPWQTVTGDAESGSGAADCERDCVVYSFDALSSNSMKSSNPHSGCRRVDVAKCLDTTDPNPCKNQGGIAVLEPVPYTLKIRSGCEGGGKGALIQEDLSATLTGGHESSISDFTSVVIEPVCCLQGGGATSQNSQGMGHKMNTSYTLNTTDVHGIAFQIYQSTVGALCARDYKGVGSQYVGEDKVVIENVPPRYIVRRLTPTECARLQGFPDTWGHPDAKIELTDDEYQFWLNVRNTHAVIINNKDAKEYTKDQILKWYNGLHTDSSEYKMWGNGIALPNALYVMQGIAEVMTEEKSSRRKWLYDLLGDCL